MVEKFPELELKERIFWIRENLQKYVSPRGDDFQATVHILLNALPEPLDPTKRDDDFGDFIFAPFSDFIARYGCDEKNLEFSLDALERMTKNFSCEDAIRFFLNTFPEKTLEKMKSWSVSDNYHVRRLASEGTRPSLPWCQKVSLDMPWVIENILANLFFDSTRFVVRSVANHMNDISKKYPDLVIDTLKKWQGELRSKRVCPGVENSERFSTTEEGKKEKKFLISHSLRTLVKKGNVRALQLLGYRSDAKIFIENFCLHTPKIFVGDSAKFSFDVVAQQDEKIMIDYLIHFIGKNGNVLPPKTFKIKKILLQHNKKIYIEKKHPLRIMTTKKLYSGIHTIDLQINGKIFEGGEFLLKQ